MKQYLFALYTQIHVNVIGLPVYLCLNVLIEDQGLHLIVDKSGKKTYTRKNLVREVFNELI